MNTFRLLQSLPLTNPPVTGNLTRAPRATKLSPSPDRNYGIYHLIDRMHHQSDLARSRYARLIDHLSTKGTLIRTVPSRRPAPVVFPPSTSSANCPPWDFRSSTGTDSRKRTNPDGFQGAQRVASHPKYPCGGVNSVAQQRASSFGRQHVWMRHCMRQHFTGGAR